MFKLFGGNKGAKKSNFFLELKEDSPEPAKEAPVVELKAAPAPAAKKEEPKVTPAPAIKKTPVTKSVSKVEPAVSGFATENAIAQTLTRRLPGPSMNQFKAMASQIRR